jgi:hypothetical protein
MLLPWGVGARQQLRSLQNQTGANEMPDGVMFINYLIFKEKY